MRIDYQEHSEITDPMRALNVASSGGTLEPKLLELVKVRASQLNGCAHCLAMHMKDARAIGESDDRLDLVPVWHEAPVFDERERAALMWCEELTLIAEREVPDGLFNEMSKVFTEDEIWRLTLAIVAINSWNRLAIAFRTPSGNYVSRRKPDPTKP